MTYIRGKNDIQCSENNFTLIVKKHSNVKCYMNVNGVDKQ